VAIWDHDEVVDLDLRPERLEIVTVAIVGELRAAIPASDCQLRCSLAAGAADQYSDIDLLWTVPEGNLCLAVEVAPTALARVAPVASVRLDPEFLHSATGRLLFARFERLPLFWRVDLEIRSLATRTDLAAAYVPTRAEEPHWSLGASAAANAVAAIKAVLRGQLDVAAGLLERGFTRIDGTLDAGESWSEAITRLARSAAIVDPSVVGFATEITELAQALLPTKDRLGGRDSSSSWDIKPSPAAAPVKVGRYARDVEEQPAG
jgi:hypothetical protein